MLLSNYEPNATDCHRIYLQKIFSIQEPVENIMHELCSAVPFSNSNFSEKKIALIKNEYNIHELPESTNVLKEICLIVT